MHVNVHDLKTQGFQSVPAHGLGDSVQGNCPSLQYIMLYGQWNYPVDGNEH